MTYTTFPTGVSDLLNGGMSPHILSLLWTLLSLDPYYGGHWTLTSLVFLVPVVFVLTCKANFYLCWLSDRRISFPDLALVTLPHHHGRRLVALMRGYHVPGSKLVKANFHNFHLGTCCSLQTCGWQTVLCYRMKKVRAAVLLMTLASLPAVSPFLVVAWCCWQTLSVPGCNIIWRGTFRRSVLWRVLWKLWKGSLELAP